jgi:hypothetical protein
LRDYLREAIHQKVQIFGSANRYSNQTIRTRNLSRRYLSKVRCQPKDLLPPEEEVRRGLSPSELQRLKKLERENAKLKQLVPDLALDKRILQEVLSKKE